jgi:hypothetical protein
MRGILLGMRGLVRSYVTLAIPEIIDKTYKQWDYFVVIILQLITT